VIYVGMLFYAMGQKALYVDLLQGFRKRSAIQSETLAPA